MEGGFHNQSKKRKGSSLGGKQSSKKSAMEDEQAMILDEYGKDSTNSAAAVQYGSYLSRIVEMVQQTADSNEENLCHLASLANLASDEQAAKELIQLGIERKIGGHLLNKNLKIQEKVAGIFRNISTSGGVDACLSLIRNGIVTQGGTAVKDSVCQLKCIVKNKDNESLKQVSCCLKQLIALLWNLCEASETAMMSFNEENIIISLLEAFHLAESDKELLLIIVQCLCTVTEDNDAAIGILMSSKSSLERIIQLLDGFETSMKDLLLASTAPGVLLNIFGKLEDSLRSKVTDKMLKIIIHTLTKCCGEELKEISLTTKEQERIDDCLDLIKAKQVCLEHLANLLCYEDECEMMEISDEDSEDFVYDENITGPTLTDERNQFQIYLKEVLLKNDVAEKVEHCITYIDVLGLQSLRENNDTDALYRALTRLQKSALACLSNILEMKAVDDVAFLAKLWTTMIHISSDQPDKDEEFWLEVTGCLRALVVAMTDRNSYEFLTNGSFEILEKWYRAAKDEQTKCNLLKIFGIAGKFYSQQEDSEHYLQKIAAILSQELVQGNSIIMITETLDTTFDAFGEDGVCDKVLVSSGLAKKLCQFPAILKAKVKSTKRIGQPYKSLIHSTRINLNNFVSYKKLKS